MAKSSKIFSSQKHYLLIFLVLAASIRFAKCQENDGGGEEEVEEPVVEKTCQASIFSLVTGIIPIIPKCLFGPNTIDLKLTNIFEALPRIYCVLKCVFAELTVFGPDGLLDEVSALLFFQEAVPEYALAPIVEIAQPCLALSSNFKPKEYYCQSYSPFVQCITGVLVRGIGPFALECFGTPLFSGLFGLLNFVVPPVRPGPEDNAVRRIQGPANRTGIITKQQRLPFSSENILPKNLNNSSNNQNLTVPEVPSTSTSTSTSTTLPTLFMNVFRNNAAAAPGPGRYINRNNFNLRHMFNQNFNNFHTNNSNTITYQLDRLTNLAKSLTAITNNVTRFF